MEVFFFLIITNIISHGTPNNLIVSTVFVPEIGTCLDFFILTEGHGRSQNFGAFFVTSNSIMIRTDTMIIYFVL
jgi:hypothetical protein